MWVRYRESRNKVTSAIRSTKRRYHMHKAALLMKPDCPSAMWWKAAKELTGQTVDVKGVPPLQDMKGSFVNDKKGKAALLRGEVRRKMNFTYVLGFGVLRDVVKVFVVSSSSFARKTTGRNRARSHSGA